ncbi:MAG: peptidase [Lunatimonas sp.]|uniref:M14 family metallopeptidase n=1 Tax=Lunatimonas sp. TaxID=2060141 RepID=UPI00263A6160|nr:M14 family metallopeptidase [Lunatimonas sp.]MCC5935760.1 peptidase [Lunatimonas sp.]
MKHLLFGLGMMVSLTITVAVNGQGDYPTLDQLAAQLRQLANAHPEATLKSLGKTAGGKDIWVLEVGTGRMDSKPAMAVFGGVEGYHLLGVTLALKFAENLLTSNKEILDSQTFYIFPNMSPDAYQQYFAPIKYERRGNATAVDHDRDGAVSEDGYDDLNGDGYITMMRIESPLGGYIASEENPLLLRPIDSKKGEKGTHMYLIEGIDNDKDGQLNEDLEEGIAFNKSLSYQFPAFEALAGDFPVSQIESRLLLDYLYERVNIYTVFTFGPANNLSEALPYQAANAQKRVVTSILEKDAQLNQRLATLYGGTVSLKSYGQTNQGTPGDFFQWAYFHFARLSLSTPGWWVPEMKTGDTKNFRSSEANFLAWADSMDMEDVFVPWTKIEHPDYPGKQVEVGGIKPFVMHNPPFGMADSLALMHTDFILQVARQHPKLMLLDLKTETLDKDLTRITVELFNDAPFPTHTEMGKRSRWFQKIRVDMGREAADILVGDKIKLIDSLEAYGKTTLSWVVKGKGAVRIQAGAPHTGFTEITVNL